MRLKESRVRSLIFDVAIGRWSLNPGVQIIVCDPKSPIFYDDFIFLLILSYFTFYWMKLVTTTQFIEYTKPFTHEFSLLIHLNENI